MINGLPNRDGTVDAVGTSTAKVVPTYSTNRVEPDGKRQPPFIAGRWADATVKVNLSEIQDRMAKRKVPIRSTKVWSQEIDHAVRNGVAKAGAEHLIFDTNTRDIYGSIGLTTGSTAYTTVFSEAHNLPTPELVIANNIFMHGIVKGMERYTYAVGKKYGGYDTEGYHWSLLNGPQLDRALVLKTLSQSTRVAKQFKTK